MTVDGVGDIGEPIGIAVAWERFGGDGILLRDAPAFRAASSTSKG